MLPLESPSSLICSQYAPERKPELRLKIDGNEMAEEGVLFSEAVFIS